MFVFAFNLGYQEFIVLAILGVLPLLAIFTALAILFYINRDRGDDHSEE